MKETGCCRVLFVCLSLLLFAASGVADNKDFTICVHPYKSSIAVHKSFAPLAEYLSEAIGEKVEIHVAPNYESHISAVGSDKFGIGYLGPASYVKLVGQYGLKRIIARQAVDGEPVFRGKIIVREDSPIRSLEDLAGKRFAFGDPDSTMSHLVPRYMLIEAGVGSDRLAKIEFLGNHTNVALAVLAGSFDAGAVKEAVFYNYQARGLRALSTTPALSEHLFVAGDNLTDDQVEKFREAMLGMHNTKPGLKALQAIKSNITALVPAEDSDYDNLRQILATLKQHKVIP